MDEIFVCLDFCNNASVFVAAGMEKCVTAGFMRAHISPSLSLFARVPCNNGSMDRDCYFSFQQGTRNFRIFFFFLYKYLD